MDMVGQRGFQISGAAIVSPDLGLAYGRKPLVQTARVPARVPDSSWSRPTRPGVAFKQKKKKKKKKQKKKTKKKNTGRSQFSFSAEDVGQGSVQLFKVEFSKKTLLFSKCACEVWC